MAFLIGLGIFGHFRKKARNKGNLRKENVIIGLTGVYFVVSAVILIGVPFPTIEHQVSAGKTGFSGERGFIVVLFLFVFGLVALERFRVNVRDKDENKKENILIYSILGYFAVGFVVLLMIAGPVLMKCIDFSKTPVCPESKF